MRAVVQKVTSCTVRVEGEMCAHVDRGLLVYLGVATGDDQDDIEYIVDKVSNLRIFKDEGGGPEKSILQAGGSVCVVSQFTLMGDARKGRRPSWDEAAPPEEAQPTYEKLCDSLAKNGVQVEKGVFRAHMAVTYTNDGPITILLDSRKLF